MLFDVCGEVFYVEGYVLCVISLLYLCLNEKILVDYFMGMLFVVYCVGFYCNGIEKVVICLVKLGCLVKKMIGGVTGWLDEGFMLVIE